jgi:hypothetical protein
MGMTPRQRKYWMAMGDRRQAERMQAEQRIIERGQIPVG